MLDACRLENCHQRIIFNDSFDLFEEKEKKR